MTVVNLDARLAQCKTHFSPSLSLTHTCFFSFLLPLAINYLTWDAADLRRGKPFCSPPPPRPLPLWFVIYGWSQIRQLFSQEGCFTKSRCTLGQRQALVTRLLCGHFKKGVLMSLLSSIVVVIVKHFSLFFPLSKYCSAEIFFSVNRFRISASKRSTTLCSSEHLNPSDGCLPGQCFCQYSEALDTVALCILHYC